MSESSNTSQTGDKPLTERLKDVFPPDGLINKKSTDVQRTGEQGASRSLHKYVDPAVYDSSKTVIGYVEVAPNGRFEAKLTDVAIAGTFVTREEAVNKVWEAHVKRNPRATRPKQ